MSVKKRLYGCKLRAPIKCQNCVIIASRMLNDLYVMAQKSQWRTYQINNYPEYATLTYTNKFNIVIDVLMRMTYLFNTQLKQLKKEYGVRNFLMFDDSPLLFEVASKAKLKEHYDHYVIYDLKTFDPFTIQGLHKRLIHSFIEWTRYTMVSEEEDNDEIERKLAALYPKQYNISYRSLGSYNPSTPMYKENKRKAKYKFIDNILQLQCRLSSYEIRLLFEFFMLNLKANKVKELTILPVREDLDESCVFSLFNDERTLYITNQFISCVNKFFMICGKVYYPLAESNNAYQLMCVNNDILIRYITGQIDNLGYIPSEGFNVISQVKNTKYANACLDYSLMNDVKFDSSVDIAKVHKTKLNTFQKLLSQIDTESEIGVFDANSDYRYQFFENIKSVIVDECFDLVLPELPEDRDFVWISVYDYLEQLPAWIGEFNKLSHVKLVLSIQ